MPTSEPHPSQDAGVIVFLDANMPNVKECKRDRPCPEDRMCTHRFGPDVWICDRPKKVPRPCAPPGVQEVPFGRLKDLEVVQWCVGWIRRHCSDAGGSVRPRHFVLMTHDKTFLESVMEQSRNGWKGCDAGYPFAFGSGRWQDFVHGKYCRIESGFGPSSVALEVFCLHGGFRDRTHDLRLVLCCSRGLFCSCGASTPVA